MLEEYILKTIISFLSLNAVMYVTKDNWKKLNPKKNGFVKRNIFKLAMCMIPIFRWFIVAFALWGGIALENEEFVEKMKNEKGK